MPSSRLPLAVIVVLIAASIVAWPYLRNLGRTPGCTVTTTSDSTPGAAATFTLSEAQGANAATIAAVGIRLGMPDHAVTIALAAALQESNLYNLPDGDRDSAGLFQQRPSQGWGTRAQVLDPVYAATVFYEKLRAQPGWANLSVTDAAALTGELPAALTCRGLTISAPSADLVATAAAELGTTVLTGAHSQTRGWSISSWLVAHASHLGIDGVTFDGRTWTMTSGVWVQSGPADGNLSLHQTHAAA